MGVYGEGVFLLCNALRPRRGTESAISGCRLHWISWVFSCGFFLFLQNFSVYSSQGIAPRRGEICMISRQRESTASMVSWSQLQQSTSENLETFRQIQRKIGLNNVWGLHILYFSNEKGPSSVESSGDWAPAAPKGLLALQNPVQRLGIFGGNSVF